MKKEQLVNQFGENLKVENKNLTKLQKKENNRITIIYFLLSGIIISTLYEVFHIRLTNISHTAYTMMSHFHPASFLTLFLCLASLAIVWGRYTWKKVLLNFAYFILIVIVVLGLNQLTNHLPEISNVRRETIITSKNIASNIFQLVIKYAYMYFLPIAFLSIILQAFVNQSKQLIKKIISEVPDARDRVTIAIAVFTAVTALIALFK